MVDGRKGRVAKAIEGQGGDFSSESGEGDGVVEGLTEGRMVRFGRAKGEDEVAGNKGGERTMEHGIVARADVATHVDGMGWRMSSTVATHDPSEGLYHTIETSDTLCDALVADRLVRVTVIRVNSTVLAQRLLVVPLLPLLQRTTEDEVVTVGFRSGGATLLGDGDVADGAGERATTAGDEETAVVDATTTRDEGVVEVGMRLGVGGIESVEYGLTALSTDFVLLAVALVLVGEGTEATVERAAEAVSRHGERGVKTGGDW